MVLTVRIRTKSSATQTAAGEVAWLPISKCLLQTFPTPEKAWSLSLSIPLKVLFELPGRVDTICGKDKTLKLANPGLVEVGKIIGGDFKMISQRVTNPVAH